MPLLLDTSGTDVLADVLDSLRLKGRIFCRCELSAPWAIGLAAGDFSHFHIIERGTCWLRLHGERDAIALEQGDLLLVIRGRGYQLSDDPGTPPIPLEDLAGSSEWGLHAVLCHGGGGNAANLLCGAFEFEGLQAQSFLRVLPEWIRVRKDERRGNEWLDSTTRFLLRETQHPGMGAATIVTSLIDVLFVEAVRMWLREQPSGGAGWLGALRDPSIGAALGLMHHAPEKQWTVPALSAAVGLSRSPFAAKFTALVGQSPISYLKRWRLQRAAALLRHDAEALSSVAEQVGYESTAAFSGHSRVSSAYPQGGTGTVAESIELLTGEHASQFKSFLTLIPAEGRRQRRRRARGVTERRRVRRHVRGGSNRALEPGRVHCGD